MRSEKDEASCPLCQASAQLTEALNVSRAKATDWGYLHCQRCDLIFRERAGRLDLPREAQHYGLHQNSADDVGYVKFLTPTVKLVEMLQTEPAAARGLDFGSGPNPVLAGLLAARGFQMSVWDPFFAPSRTSLTADFDFITCTEVAEHFYEPAAEFDFLLTQLKAGGRLILRTEFHQGLEMFQNWYYRRDPTHVVFYSKASFEWLCRATETRPGWALEFPAPTEGSVDGLTESLSLNHVCLRKLG